MNSNLSLEVSRRKKRKKKSKQEQQKRIGNLERQIQTTSSKGLPELRMVFLSIWLIFIF